MKGVFIGGPNDGELGDAAHEQYYAEDGRVYQRNTIAATPDSPAICFFTHETVTPHGALHRVFAHYINTKKGYNHGRD